MRSAITLITLALLWGCPKPSVNHATKQADADRATIMATVRDRLDSRSWLSCARAAQVPLNQATIEVTIDARNTEGTVKVLPASDATDPGMICLAFVLRDPVELQAQDWDRQVRFSVRHVLPTVEIGRSEDSPPSP